MAPKIQRVVTIVNKLGLHARPAALLVQEAAKYASTIELQNEEMTVNGKSIMGVMMLAAAHGSEVLITADGNDADDAVRGIESLILRKFDEE
jgi:phosphocarrier protein HPr